MGRALNPSLTDRDVSAALAPSTWGRIGGAVLGVSLWAQLALFGLREVFAAPVSTGNVLMFLLPLALLGVGLVTRLPVLLVAAFPLALLAPATLVEQIGPGWNAWAAAQVCLTAALYLAVVSNWLTSVPRSRDVRRGEAKTERARAYRRYVYARLLPLTLLWAVPTYAIFWDPAIVGTISQNHGDDAVTAQVFMAVLIFFAWSITAYMFYVVPALNLEYDRRRVERSLKAFGETLDPARIWRRFAIQAGIAIVVVVLLLLVV